MNGARDLISEFLLSLIGGAEKTLLPTTRLVDERGLFRVWCAGSDEGQDGASEPASTRRLLLSASADPD